MANETQTFMQAYRAASDELESLVREQARIEQRVLLLRKRMKALATLISQDDKDGEGFAATASDRLSDLIDTTLTGDIHKIVSASRRPLSASEIRSELKELGDRLVGHRNPLATIHAILNRLSESGRVTETLIDGKKAWERVKSLAERVQGGELIAGQDTME